MNAGDRLVIEAARLDSLLEVLRRQGYGVVGPRLRDGAIVYDELRSAADLPVGWTDEQAPGRYRLARRDDGALFGYTVGPHSWKRFLHPPALTLWRAERDERGFRPLPVDAEPAAVAFVGVRACELEAIAVQDRVLLGGAWADPAYRGRRASLFLVAVNCGRAGGTCFCVSMGAGPRAVDGFDLALTEVLGPGRHDLVVEVGSERGASVAAELPHRPAAAEDLARADATVRHAAESMGRALEATGLRDLLYSRYDDPRWDDVARRCHGGSVRLSGAARYRHWITHKLATWHDQFGTSGCVGCGRCITWCPVGIDITEEIRALREPKSHGEGGHGRREL